MNNSTDIVYTDLEYVDNTGTLFMNREREDLLFMKHVKRLSYFFFSASRVPLVVNICKTDKSYIDEIKECLYKMKNSNRDRHCIEQSLLSDCNGCPYKDYCVGAGVYLV